ncbi:inositol monophosphatase family protein [Thermocrinis minervae]|uniref:Inositol-1-monophosphatase n=1 Tax=Thermocrinis minervae TaxID=381751 RepID=A0A1M6QWW8_9AQUI|nr:inositol monophosphatase family protein [Thermocrinis minervae]SHK24769.1 myo-inositol-1(or 4)-monophosphatase [Thermocrinis minervae]
MIKSDKLLRIAKESALLGGLVLKENFLKVSTDKIEEKAEKDFVSYVDRLSEERIKEHILKNFPDHSVVGEESGGSQESDYVWYVDPLDGTKNYIAGFPIFGVSVGLVYKGQPILGCVYLPYFDNLYWACKGEGAYKNGKRIQVKQKENLKHCFVAYGFPSRAKRNLSIYWEIFRDIFDKVSAMRRPGAAAVDLCLLAEGVFDGLAEFELNPWDVCAGMVIVQEAGGEVWLSKGLALRTDIVAGNKTAFSYIKDVIYLKLGEDYEPARGS